MNPWLVISLAGLVETMRCFQSKFNFTKGPNRDITNDLINHFQHTENVNDDLTENTSPLHVPVIDRCKCGSCSVSE